MKNTYTSDILVVGAGIFGLSAAIELAKRRYSVILINPDTIPHHLAASTDISKIVRMEYGSDTFYCDLADESIKAWQEWNTVMKEQMYHQVGFLLLMQKPIDDPAQDFEYQSWKLVKQKGYDPLILDQKDIQSLYPAINSAVFPHAYFNPVAGFVESGRALEKLTHYASSLGVKVMEGQTAGQLEVQKDKLTALHTLEGNRFQAEHTIIAAGANTPYLIPELQANMKSTGHPVFHFLPKEKQLMKSDHLPVFSADISNTGWYGFPVHPKKGVVKMAQHTNGLEINPMNGDRRIVDEEVEAFKAFQRKLFPKEKDTALVYTRRCLYTDTLDGDFWIDQHPRIKGLSVATGGSGHAMKMGPVLGPIIADMVEKKENPSLHRFQWRNLSEQTIQKEEARFVVGRKL